MFVSIYWPVWTDAFALTEKRKATWMSCFLVSSPVGVLFGYVLTTQLIIYKTWEFAFYAQALAVIPALILIMLIPTKYFSLKRNATSAQHPGNSAVATYEDEASIERQLDSSSDGSSRRAQVSLRQQMRDNPNLDILGRSYDSDQLDAIFADESDRSNSRALENLGMTPTTPNIDTLQNFENESMTRRIKELLQNGQFVLLTLSISSLYFVVTGL